MTETYHHEQHGELLLIEEAQRRLAEKHKIILGQQRLADLRCLGGGPEFIKPTQREVRYPTALLDAWAEKRNNKPLLEFVALRSAVHDTSACIKKISKDATTADSEIPS